MLQRFRVGGKEDVVKTLILNASPDYTPYACATQTTGFMAEQVRKEGKTVFFVDLASRKTRLVNLLKLLSILRKYRFSTIFCHDISSWFYAVLLSPFVRNSKIVHIRHSFLENESIKTLLLTRLLSFFSYKLVAVSDSIKAAMIGREKISSRKLVVVYNGIDITKYSNNISKQLIRSQLGIPSNCFISGTVTRFFPVKNIEDQIEMVSVLKNIIPNYLHVIVAPMTDYGEKLRQIASDRMLDKYILFLGFRDDIPKILSLFDVFVLTSRSEGTAVVLLEAMASQCPIVASAVGGNVDIIENKVNGILYDVNELDDLCNAIVALHGNPSYRSHLSCNGLRFVKSNHSLQSMVSGYDKLATNQPL
jgi:glycosyltransferase involved in cell wall biosynthesis